MDDGSVDFYYVVWDRDVFQNYKYIFPGYTCLKFSHRSYAKGNRINVKEETILFTLRSILNRYIYLKQNMIRLFCEVLLNAVKETLGHL